jgi:hypothetical protein
MLDALLPSPFSNLIAVFVALVLEVLCDNLSRFLCCFSVPVNESLLRLTLQTYLYTRAGTSVITTGILIVIPLL